MQMLVLERLIDWDRVFAADCVAEDEVAHVLCELQQKKSLLEFRKHSFFVTILGLKLYNSMLIENFYG